MVCNTHTIKGHKPVKSRNLDGVGIPSGGPSFPISEGSSDISEGSSEMPEIKSGQFTDIVQNFWNFKMDFFVTTPTCTMM